LTRKHPDRDRLEQHIRRLAARPDGVARPEAIGEFSVRQVTTELQRLRLDGIIHSARLGHRTVRYFTTPERAQAWQQQHRQVAPNVTITKPSGRIHAPWAPDAPERITAATLYTRGPAPQGRMAGTCPPDSALPVREGALDYQAHMTRYAQQAK
jgi:hypothetical protein